MKYIVVCRNPEEALVSFKVFLEMHTDAFYDDVAGAAGRDDAA